MANIASLTVTKNVVAPVIDRYIGGTVLYLFTPWQKNNKLVFFPLSHPLLAMFCVYPRGQTK